MTELEKALLSHPAGRKTFVAPGGGVLSFGALSDLVDRTHRQLAEFGIAPGDRVASILPNGPETAAFSVALLARGCLAPLHPGLRAEGVLDALEALRARALVHPAGAGVVPSEELLRRGITPIELSPMAGGTTGDFTLAAHRPMPATPALGDRAAHFPSGSTSDIALLLQTSGTTARPKTVPLTRSNLLASARTIAHSLALTPEDECLTLMPLFHIHGLVATLLAPMIAGGASLHPGGFDGLRIFSWIEELRPTWLSAVPTMHQTMLARARRRSGKVGDGRLRLVRSSSSALPPPVGRALEELFDCPAVEAYGMTEASHQISSNPITPGERRLGTVGRATGLELRILGADGTTVEESGEGEVILRGPNVTAGYEGNPEANEEAFTDRGWFRTGDLGRLDADGFLTLTGRLKEMINRGGEKIAPVEIDNALLEHPAVARVVTFGLPHPMLGEEVAALVVPSPASDVTEKDLVRFAAERLPAFKRPRRIFLREEVPVGPTGKVQRIGLAGRLGLD